MCDQQRLRSACAYAQFDQSRCWSPEYSMSIKLLTEHHLEFLSIKGGCRGSSKSALVKIPHCWKSHVVAHFYFGKCVQDHLQKDCYRHFLLAILKENFQTYLNPNELHTTFASLLKSSLCFTHTGPHAPFCHTSSLPSSSLFPPFSLVLPTIFEPRCLT